MRLYVKNRIEKLKIMTVKNLTSLFVCDCKSINKRVFSTINFTNLKINQVKWQKLFEKASLHSKASL